jgi:hypothetical protein
MNQILWRSHSYSTLEEVGLADAAREHSTLIAKLDLQSLWEKDLVSSCCLISLKPVSVLSKNESNKLRANFPIY